MWLVQKKGAEAVLATLWPVADAATPALMQAIYRLRQSYPALPKAELLRRAQVALLTGGVKPASNDMVSSPKRRNELYLSVEASQLTSRLSTEGSR